MPQSDLEAQAASVGLASLAVPGPPPPIGRESPTANRRQPCCGDARLQGPPPFGPLTHPPPGPALSFPQKPHAEGISSRPAGPFPQSRALIG